MPPRIRAATPEDLDALLALEHAVFPGDRMSRRQFRRHIAHGHNRVIVVETDAFSVAAAAILMMPTRNHYARMYSLAVRPECRGQGLAKLLCAEMERLAAKAGYAGISLEVRADNAAAIALYEALGYAVHQALEGYYDDGSDGRRMRKVF